MVVSRKAVILFVVAVSLAAAACSSPPDREMNQAEGAIQAARAAGADTYATEEYEAAVRSLERAHTAVAQRDYRLALSSALDAQERAQDAARQAAEGRAAARSQAERAVAEAAAALETAQKRLEAADAARIPAGQLSAPREALLDAAKTVQEARAAADAEDYPAVGIRLDGFQMRIQEVVAQIDAALETRPARRRNR